MRTPVAKDKKISYLMLFFSSRYKQVAYSKSYGLKYPNTKVQRLMCTAIFLTS